MELECLGRQKGGKGMGKECNYNYKIYRRKMYQMVKKINWIRHKNVIDVFFIESLNL